MVASTTHPQSVAAARAVADALNAERIFAQSAPLLGMIDAAKQQDPAHPSSWRVWVVIGLKPDPDDVAALTSKMEAVP